MTFVATAERARNRVIIINQNKVREFIAIQSEGGKTGDQLDVCSERTGFTRGRYDEETQD